MVRDWGVGSFREGKSVGDGTIGVHGFALGPKFAQACLAQRVGEASARLSA